MKHVKHVKRCTGVITPPKDNYTFPGGVCIPPTMFPTFHMFHEPVFVGSMLHKPDRLHILLTYLLCNIEILEVICETCGILAVTPPNTGDFLSPSLGGMKHVKHCETLIFGKEGSVEPHQQVHNILQEIERLSAALVDGVKGDARIAEWAAWIEMTAREFSAIPLVPGAQFNYHEEESDEGVGHC